MDSSPPSEPEQPLRLIIAADAGYRLRTGQMVRFRVCLRGRWERWASGWSSARSFRCRLVCARRGSMKESAGSGARRAMRAVSAGTFPREIQPLVDDFNGVVYAGCLGSPGHAQAGNLAHSDIEDPVGDHGRRRAARRDPQLPQLVAGRWPLALERVDYHLARSRAAAATVPRARVARVKARAASR